MARTLTATPAGVASQERHAQHPPSDAPNGYNPLRIAGGLLAVGAAVMIAGAVVHVSTGADPWGDITPFLDDADGQQTRFAWNIGLWIAGAFMMTMGTFLASDTLTRHRTVASDGVLAIARFASAAGAGAVLVFFPFMLALVEAFAGTEGLQTPARGLQLGSTLADDITTWVILGLGGVGLVFGAGTAHFGRFVRGVATVTGVAGLYYLLQLAGFVPDLGFYIVPLGMLLMLSSGIALLRRA